MTTEEIKQKKKKHRSPNYPFISLKDACDKTQTIWSKEGKHSVNADIVIKHWEYGAKSSGGRLAISALLKYGLFEEVESEKERELKLTDRAMVIILGEDEARKKALKEAALEPKIYKELWEKFGHELPSEDSLKNKLILDWGFNQTIVHKFIKDYKETISFSGLQEGDVVEENLEMPKTDIQVDQKNSADKSLKALQNKKTLAQYSIPLGPNEATIVFTGTSLSPDDFDALADYVALFKKQYERKLISETSKEEISEKNNL